MGEIYTTQMDVPDSISDLENIERGQKYSSDYPMTAIGVPDPYRVTLSAEINRQISTRGALDLQIEMEKVFLKFPHSGDTSEVLRNQPILRPGEQMERLAFADSGGGSIGPGGNLGT